MVIPLFEYVSLKLLCKNLNIYPKSALTETRTFDCLFQLVFSLRDEGGM